LNGETSKIVEKNRGGDGVEGRKCYPFFTKDRDHQGKRMDYKNDLEEGTVENGNFMCQLNLKRWRRLISVVGKHILSHLRNNWGRCEGGNLKNEGEERKDGKEGGRKENGGMTDVQVKGAKLMIRILYGERELV